MTAYTVTGTTTNNTFGGGILKVYVLDNAALAGTPATGSSTTAYNCAVTPTATGSLIFGGANNESATAAFTAEGNTTISDDQSINAGGAEGCAFYTTATTTSGQVGNAQTVGSSSAFGGTYGAVAMEILASGGTLSIDGSSPAAVQSLTLTSFTTASFSPSAGSILVAVLSACGNDSANVLAGTVSSSPSITFTEQIKINSTVSPANSYVGVWTAVVPASVTSGPALSPQFTGAVPVVVASRAGWRGAQHSR